MLGAASAAAKTSSNGHAPTNASKEDEDEDGGEDEVALYFDADYELEEQTTNLLLHPRVGTVTYLSDHGAPTAIFNLKSPHMDDIQRKSLETRIDKVWLSHPQIGKHTAFDGRLLHGAPALYFPSRDHPSNQPTSTRDGGTKNQKTKSRRLWTQQQETIYIAGQYLAQSLGYGCSTIG